MSTPKVLAEARAKVAEARAEVAQAEASQKKVKAPEVPASQKRTTAWQRGDGSVILGMLQVIGAGWGAKTETLDQDLRSGAVKIDPHVPGIVGSAPKTLQKRMRLLLPADQRKRVSLQKRIAALQEQLHQHELDSWDRGEEWSADEWVTYVTRTHKRRERERNAYWEGMQSQHRVESARRRLEDAEIHLAWAKGDRKDDCICSHCSIARQMAENARRAKEALARREEEARAFERAWKTWPVMRGQVCPAYHEDSDEKAKQLRIDLANGTAVCHQHKSVGRVKQEVIDKYAARALARKDKAA